MLLLVFPADNILLVYIIIQSISIIRSINRFPPFFIKNWAFIVKERYLMFYSKYCPSLATTFSHLSGSIWIPRRKNASSFEAIHESIQFLIGANIGANILLLSYP